MFQFLLNLVCLSFLLVGFPRMFNRWESCNALSKLLELSLCYLIFDLLLGFNLSMINGYLQLSSQFFSLLLMELLLLSELSAESELQAIGVLPSQSGEISASLLDEEFLQDVSSIMTVSSLEVFVFAKALFSFLYLALWWSYSACKRLIHLNLFL